MWSQHILFRNSRYCWTTVYNIRCCWPFWLGCLRLNVESFECCSQLGKQSKVPVNLNSCSVLLSHWKWSQCWNSLGWTCNFPDNGPIWDDDVILLIWFLAIWMSSYTLCLKHCHFQLFNTVQQKHSFCPISRFQMIFNNCPTWQKPHKYELAASKILPTLKTKCWI